MIEIKQFYGRGAVQTIAELNIQDDMIEQWRGDQGVSCLILYDGNMATSFILLSSMDFDPLGLHIAPKTLNFIYTMTEHRRKGYAYNLVKQAMEKHQFTAFCSNSDSESLFKKCNCINYGEMNYCTMYRYP
jgi:hypothetical protein